MASIDALEQTYPSLLADGPEGVTEEYFGFVLLDKLFIADITEKEQEQWKDKNKVRNS